MSIFGTIMGKIFGTPAEAAPTSAQASPPPHGATRVQTARETPKATPSAGTASHADIEIGPILDAAVKAKGEKLEWRTSIVDLLKALDIDSSLTARKELAKELHYTGDTNDSATMNVWLHKEVVAKMAANGGKLPADMKH